MQLRPVVQIPNLKIQRRGEPNAEQNALHGTLLNSEKLKSAGLGGERKKRPVRSVPARKRKGKKKGDVKKKEPVELLGRNAGPGRSRKLEKQKPALKPERQSDANDDAQER